MKTTVAASRHPAKQTGRKNRLPPVRLVLPVLLCLIYFLLPPHSLNSATAGNLDQKSLREYQVKAAFLYNFAKFIFWPKENIKQSPSFLIGILGKDPFGTALEEVISMRSLKGKPVVIKRATNPQDLADCQVVFIAESEKSRLPEDLQFFQKKSILTTSEIAGFAQSGGMIEMMVIKKQIRFDINSTAAQRAKLRIRSQLLELARKIVSEK